MKVVINRCFGGFGLSDAAVEAYFARKGKAVDPDFRHRDVPRDDPDLVAVVEELGKKAYGDYAELKVVEVPDGTDWFIDEYDGLEHVAEQHQTWS